jgi:hypothetical protein
MRLVALCALAALGSNSALAGQTPTQSQLNLTCFGGGTAKKVTVISGSNSGYLSGMVGSTPVSGTVSGSSSVVIPRREGFTDQVDVEFFSGNDRIRLPSSTIPAFHGGQGGGWYKLKDVVADAHSIRAKALVNFINHPSIYVDRVTGTISIAGRDGDYTGQCQATDANAPAKF